MLLLLYSIDILTNREATNNCKIYLNYNISDLSDKYLTDVDTIFKI